MAGAVASGYLHVGSSEVNDCRHIISLIEGTAGVLPQNVTSFQPIGIAGGTILQVGLGILVLMLRC